jgi:hypothetical protein
MTKVTCPEPGSQMTTGSVTAPAEVAEAMENDMMFARCQVEAMREAIRRAVEKAKEGLENGRYASYLKAVAADLEQALNERKET